MGYLKFITICDDNNMAENREMLKKLDITALPAMYFCNNSPRIDLVNADSQTFYDDFQSGSVTSAPCVPADIFEYEFLQAYKIGYLGVFLVLPHNRWSDFKHQAEIAKKRFLRKNNIDEQGFKIKFCDSKTFAGGTLCLTIALARKYRDYHYSVDSFIDYFKYNKIDKFTYILSKDANLFDNDAGFNGYIIKNNNISRMNISQYPDSVIFDKFAKEFVDNLKNYDYNVSSGFGCDFEGNVLGRIEMLSGKLPVMRTKYGVSSTQILGKSSLCFNFVNKYELIVV